MKKNTRKAKTIRKKTIINITKKEGGVQFTRSSIKGKEEH
jgi:hypothetical protein